jgi:small GTP-binding protein
MTRVPDAATVRYKLKAVMLGDFAVGKTSLVNRYVLNAFDESYLATLGVRVSRKEIAVEMETGREAVGLMLWDINGDDGFHSVRSQYLRGAAGAIVICDLTRPDTLDRAGLHAQAFEAANPGRPVAFAFNKIDLVAPQKLDAARRRIGRDDRFADGSRFFTSAKTAESVEALFDSLTARMVAAAREAR